MTDARQLAQLQEDITDLYNYLLRIYSKIEHVAKNEQKALLVLLSRIEQLEKEVRKYVAHEPVNYGKAAKRMYNVFRLTGRYEEAAYLRELFDEPAAMLYQVWSLIRTIDDCCNPESPIDQAHMLAQADELIISVIQALEGEQETEIVRQLLRLRDTLTRQEANHELTSEAEAARAQVINVVNNFFYEKMTALPRISQYMIAMQEDTV